MILPRASLKFALLPVLISGFGLGMVMGEERTPIPEDLLFDEHVREEFGVNEITAPSIERIFKDLEALGDLPYNELSRKLPENAPKQRSIAALSLGMIIADGLLTVQCEQRGALKPIGETLKAHAEALGADKRMNRHTKSLVEHSLSGEWEQLKTELAATQGDVQAELILLRDVQIAHLISLGGWLRASQIACVALERDFDAEKAAKILRLDVLDYFISELEYFEADLLSKGKLSALRKDLKDLREAMEPEGKERLYTKAQMTKLGRQVDTILTRALMVPIPSR